MNLIKLSWFKLVAICHFVRCFRILNLDWDYKLVVACRYPATWRIPSIGLGVQIKAAHLNWHRLYQYRPGPLSSDGRERKEIETESKIPSLELGRFWQRVILIGCLPMSQSAGVVSLDPRQNVNQEVCLIFPNFLEGPKISPKALGCVGNLNRLSTDAWRWLWRLRLQSLFWQWKCWRIKSWYSQTLKTDG